MTANREKCKETILTTQEQLKQWMDETNRRIAALQEIVAEADKLPA